jgi:hypothetical protein
MGFSCTGDEDRPFPCVTCATKNYLPRSEVKFNSIIIGKKNHKPLAKKTCVILRTWRTPLEISKMFRWGFIVSNKAPKASYEVAETQTIAESLILQTFRTSQHNTWRESGTRQWQDTVIGTHNSLNNKLWYLMSKKKCQKSCTFKFNFADWWVHGRSWQSIFAGICTCH